MDGDRERERQTDRQIDREGRSSFIQKRERQEQR